jgi:hypothetical protein
MTTPDSNLDKQQLTTPPLPEAALRDALGELYDLEGRSIKAYSVRLAGLEAVDALVERVEVAERERDDLQACLNHEETYVDAMLPKLRAERDRLREALQRIVNDRSLRPSVMRVIALDALRVTEQGTRARHCECGHDRAVEVQE